MAKKELSKEQSEDALRLIEVIRANGKVRKGTNEVTKAIERNQAKLVVIAKDVSPAELVMHLPLLCEEKSVPCVVAGSREELGAAAGLTVGTVAVAITEDGSSKADLQKFVDSL
ncbi:MAG TPA: ribosomal L7Ae/L30e/S12e/Gadd45 family protein [Acidobacteriota bacterium]|nr:ribosomal L7Ae/L30e/S12e/Gadd45 family protein [Acidobacteriota bacterium]